MICVAVSPGNLKLTVVPPLFNASFSLVIATFAGVPAIWEFCEPELEEPLVLLLTAWETVDVSGANFTPGGTY